MAEDSRKHKLAMARKKLREFRERRSPTLTQSDMHSSSSSLMIKQTVFNDQLHTNTQIDDFSGRQSVASLPVGNSNFQHDDERSPFERVRGRSETRSLAGDRDRNRDPSPPPEHLSNTSTLNGSHDHSALHISSSLPTDSTNPTETESMSYTNQAADIHYNGRVSQSVLTTSTALHAQPTTMDSAAVVNGQWTAQMGHVPVSAPSTDNDHSLRTYTEHEQSAPPTSSSSQNGTSATSPSNSSIDSTQYYQQLITDNTTLKATVQTQHSQMAQMNEQLQQIHGHYAQLHAAYTNLSSTNNGATSAINEDTAQQQQTISILVQEKAELQSQLRQAMQLANEKHVLNEELQGRLTSARDRVEQLERSQDTVTGARTQLEHTLSKQKLELDKRRHESATWEAKVVGLQQDKSELQARLKVKAREVDRLQADIGDLRKEIQMKEIYIRQLSAHAAGLTQANEQEEHMRNIQNELDNVRLELTASAANTELYKQEAQQATHQYEQYGRQLNQQLLTLSQQLERDAEEKLRLTSECERLKEQLEENKTQTTVQIIDNGNVDVETNDNATDTDREHTQTNSDCDNNMNTTEQNELVHRLQHDLAVTTARMHELNTRLEQSNASLSLAERRAAMLDEQLTMHKQYSSDSAHLIEQVVNERATVSRAVAQNRELKDQLAELQDTFVKLTNENALLTEQQQSDAHALQQLQALNQSVTDRLQALLHLLQQHLHHTQLDCNNDTSNMSEPENVSSVESVLVATEHAVRVVCESHAQLHSQQHALTQQLGETDALRTERDTLKQHNITLRASIDHHRTILAAQQQSPERSEQLSTSLDGDAANNSGNLSEDSELQQRYEQLQKQLYDTVSAKNRVAQENNELHMIMQQNAEDENQNTIHVELQQALDRITQLNSDNGQLRTQLEHLQHTFSQLNTTTPTVTDANTAPNSSTQNGTGTDATTVVAESTVMNGNQNDDHSSNCSEHRDNKCDAQSLDQLQSLQTAMSQLQTRFTKAMTQNADLADQNQQLEHLITQLQHETDTVGEYITIYQHHRKMIRERLREKELNLAKLTREKDAVQSNLHSLQQLVMQLLREKGHMHSYKQSNRTSRANSRSHSPAVTLPQLHRRTYSETQVDETSGDECVIVAADATADIQSEDTRSVSESVRSRSASGEGDIARLDRVNEEDMQDTSTSEQIVRLLTQLTAPDQATMSPMTHKCMHCNDCTGKLMVL